MRANTAISPLILKDLFTLFWKINHAPIPANTIKIEEKKNESSSVKDACSETDCVSVSDALRNGFAALRYRNAGKLSIPEEAIAMPAITTPPKRTSSGFTLLLIFLTRAVAARNAVQPIRKNPERDVANIIPVFSNDIVTNMNADTKITQAETMNLLSFLRNGNARIKNPIGIMKN